MRKLLVAAVLAIASFAIPLAMAQTNPLIGKWKTLDDETGKAMTVSEIYMAKNGKLASKIVENLGLPPTCEGCSGEYHGKPFVGIVTMWNLSSTGANTWGNGNGYKPSEDRHFKVKSVELIDNGERLRVTGCVLFICRKAEWVRVH
ncbi:MAG: DUF2147 domain-containing protein [Thermomonas sp.]